jgi:hypothetical protein
LSPFCSRGIEEGSKIRGVGSFLDRGFRVLEKFTELVAGEKKREDHAVK